MAYIMFPPPRLPMRCARRSRRNPPCRRAVFRLAEAGEAGVRLQAELVRVADEAGVLMLGPQLPGLRQHRERSVCTSDPDPPAGGWPGAWRSSPSRAHSPMNSASSPTRRGSGSASSAPPANERRSALPSCWTIWSMIRPPAPSRSMPRAINHPARFHRGRQNARAAPPSRSFFLKLGPQRGSPLP